MLVISPAIRIFVCLKPVDMRCSLDGLTALARSEVKEEPMLGHLFLFHLTWDVNRLRFQDNSAELKIRHMEQKMPKLTISKPLQSSAHRFSQIVHLVLGLMLFCGTQRRCDASTEGIFPLYITSQSIENYIASDIVLDLSKYILDELQKGSNPVVLDNKAILQENVSLNFPQASLVFTDCTFSKTFELTRSSLASLDIDKCKNLERFRMEDVHISGSVSFASKTAIHRFYSQDVKIDGTLTISSDIIALKENDGISLSYSSYGNAVWIYAKEISSKVDLANSTFLRTCIISAKNLRGPVLGTASSFSGGLRINAQRAGVLWFDHARGGIQWDFNLGSFRALNLSNSEIHGNVNVNGAGGVGEGVVINLTSCIVHGALSVSNFMKGLRVVEMTLSKIDDHISLSDLKVGAISANQTSCSSNLQITRCYVGDDGIIAPNMNIVRNFEIENCTIDGHVEMNGSNLQHLRLKGVRIRRDKGISATAINVASVLIEGFRSKGLEIKTSISGPMLFNASKIAINFDISESEIYGPVSGSPLLELDYCDVGKNVFLGPNLTVKGSVSLNRISIEKDLQFRGVKILSEISRTSVQSQAARVGGATFLSWKPFDERGKSSYFQGRLLFTASKFGASFVGDGAQVRADPSNPALELDHCTIDGSLFLKSLRIEGYLRAHLCKIVGDVQLTSSTIASPIVEQVRGLDLSSSEIAGSLKMNYFYVPSGVSLSDATVTGRLTIEERVSPYKILDLSGCKIGVLEDKENGWPGALWLSGFTFKRFSDDPMVPVDFKDRYKWVKLAREADEEQALFALCEVYRNMGSKENQKNAYREWQIAKSTLTGKVLGMLTDYGNQPVLRPGLLLIILWCMSTFVCFKAYRNGMIVPRRHYERRKYTPSSFVAPLFALASLLPVATQIRDDWTWRESTVESRDKIYMLGLHLGQVVYTVSVYLLLSMLVFALGRTLVRL